MFVERKIASKMKSEAFRHFDALGGWADLQDQVSSLP